MENNTFELSFETLERIWPSQTFQEKIKMAMVKMDFRTPWGPSDGVVYISVSAVNEIMDIVYKELSKVSEKSKLDIVFANIRQAMESLREYEIQQYSIEYYRFEDHSQMATVWIPILKGAERELLTRINGSTELVVTIQMLTMYIMACENML